MKWFSRSKVENNTPSVEQVLSQLHTDGVHLTIQELLQYQSKAGLIDLKASKNQQSKMAGNYLARSKGRGMEFDEVRHYQHGDDIRAIDWRVTARTGKTHTKLFREEIERPVLVATDFSQSMLFGTRLLCKSVQAAHLASLVAWHAKQRGDRLGGIVFNESAHIECKPRSRKQGVLHYLHTLQEIHQLSLTQQEPLTHQTAVSAFEENCQRLRQIAKPGSLVYLITDGNGISEQGVRHLSIISRHCELVVAMIVDPLEQNLPDVGYRLNVAMTDGESRQQFTLGDAKIKQAYQLKARKLMSGKQGLLQKAGARVFTISTDSSIEAQLTDGVSHWIR
ncbi:DUF58 domain-containing protein [Thalassotalea euphylliae]|uniref:DUF58 domain-containing protein n=1 Tax=Thalassotalea euphylliae TaxID=1655234 RepID=UPI0036413D8E